MAWPGVGTAGCASSLRVIHAPRLQRRSETSPGTPAAVMCTCSVKTSLHLALRAGQCMWCVSRGLLHSLCRDERVVCQAPRRWVRGLPVCAAGAAYTALRACCVRVGVLRCAVCRAWRGGPCAARQWPHPVLHMHGEVCAGPCPEHWKLRLREYLKLNVSVTSEIIPSWHTPGTH